MKEFFAMGGYAFFVWTSYAIVAFALIANVIAAKMKRKRVFKELRELTQES